MPPPLLGALLHPPGTLLTTRRTQTLRGEDWAGGELYVLVLSGASEKTGANLCCGIRADGEWQRERGCTAFLNSLPLADRGAVPAAVADSVAEVMESPPHWGVRRAPRAPPPMSKVHSSCRALTDLPLIPVLGSARGLSEILYESADGPRRDISTLVESARLSEWGVTMPHGRVLLYGQLQSRVVAAGSLGHVDFATSYLGGGGLAPTMPRSPNYHLVYRAPGAGVHYLFASTPQELELFDVREGTVPWETAMRMGRVSARMAHEGVCQGWSARVSSVVYRALQQWPRSPLYRVARWRVALLFAGLDMSTAGLDHCDIEHEVVYASEKRGAWRDELGRAYPSAVLEKDAGAPPERLHEAPGSDVALVGFPCGPYSSLNRDATREQAEAALSLLDRAMEYVRWHLPSVVVLENVAHLRAPRWEWALDEVCRIVTSVCDAAGEPAYDWYLGELCPSEFGGSMYRPRLYWVGLRRSGV